MLPAAALPLAVSPPPRHATPFRHIFADAAGRHCRFIFAFAIFDSFRAAFHFIADFRFRFLLSLITSHFSAFADTPFFSWLMLPFYAAAADYFFAFMLPFRRRFRHFRFRYYCRQAADIRRFRRLSRHAAMPLFSSLCHC